MTWMARGSAGISTNKGEGIQLSLHLQRLWGESSQWLAMVQFSWLQSSMLPKERIFCPLSNSLRRGHLLLFLSLVRSTSTDLIGDGEEAFVLRNSGTCGAYFCATGCSWLSAEIIVLQDGKVWAHTPCCVVMKSSGLAIKEVSCYTQVWVMFMWSHSWI